MAIYWTNCAFGLYPSSGVSRNKQNWGIKNIDKISQYKRPQNSHKDQFCGPVYCDILYIFLIPHFCLFLETPEDG
jgi:hypothetical protein